MSKVITDKNRIKEVLGKGVEKIYPSAGALEEVLRSGKRIRLYCGYDATASTLHLGHTVTLRKLAQFQALGHEVTMLVGDFTAMIGDPTDKAAARKKLTRKEVLENLKNYKKQASKILKFSGANPVKLVFNSKWHDKLTFLDLIELASNFTVQQMIVRDMFQGRMKKKKPIYLHEFLYPLAQAYDSVIMDVDLEVGASDQIFNMLCGRDLMRILKNKEKLVLAVKLLVVDPSGKKMGKTEGNMVRLDEKPEEMFGKIMSWPDEAIVSGFELCTDLSMKEVEEISKRISSKKLNPRDVKARLAREIVTIYHGKVVAQKAGKEFDRVFKEKKAPTHLESFDINKIEMTDIASILVETGLSSSKSEARRLIDQGAVKLDNEVIKDWQQKITPRKGAILKVGKRRFVKLA